MATVVDVATENELVSVLLVYYFYTNVLQVCT